MEKQGIQALADYAQRNFEEAGMLDEISLKDTAQLEIGWMHTRLLAELVLQLAEANTHLARIAAAQERV